MKTEGSNHVWYLLALKGDSRSKASSHTPEHRRNPHHGNHNSLCWTCFASSALCLWQLTEGSVGLVIKAVIECKEPREDKISGYVVCIRCTMLWYIQASGQYFCVPLPPGEPATGEKSFWQPGSCPCFSPQGFMVNLFFFANSDAPDCETCVCWASFHIVRVRLTTVLLLAFKSFFLKFFFALRI